MEDKERYAQLRRLSLRPDGSDIYNPWSVLSIIYIIELKYDGTPEEALRQIDEKDYARKFATDPCRLFKIGVNFSSETSRLESWKIED